MTAEKKEALAELRRKLSPIEAEMNGLSFALEQVNLMRDNIIARKNALREQQNELTRKVREVMDQ